MKEKNPGAIFLPIETSGDGAVNVYSRVQMMLFKARLAAWSKLPSGRSSRQPQIPTSGLASISSSSGSSAFSTSSVSGFSARTYSPCVERMTRSLRVGIRKEMGSGKVAARQGNALVLQQAR